MSNVVEWLGRSRPRIRREPTPIHKMGALSSLLRETPNLSARELNAIVQEADAITMVIENFIGRVRNAGFIAEAAAYRKLADDSHLIAARIEAPFVKAE